ncbi:MAG TPA: universal stress protein [Bdellovibrio sp.]|uniref:universal stress protein n=1 Tax=Bdellovibrio sp. TaxID=28201 RepID=UPI002F24F469
MKNPIETLVVAVDFSNYSRTVAHEAKQLSDSLHLPLTYVFALEDLVASDISAAELNDIRKTYEAKVRSEYNLSRAQRIVIRFGPAAREIIAAARHEINPLIIVGYHGAHPFARFFMGSVTEALVKESPFPLWIHRGEKASLPKKILIPSDLEQHSETALEKAQFLTDAWNSELEVYHVFQDFYPAYDSESWLLADDIMKSWDDEKFESFKKAHPTLKVHRTRGTITQCIRDYSKNFDLIALAGHDKNEDFLLPLNALTAQMLHEGNKPILLVP